jgi:hypothetical protein
VIIYVILLLFFAFFRLGAKSVRNSVLDSLFSENKKTAKAFAKAVLHLEEITTFDTFTG